MEFAPFRFRVIGRETMSVEYPVMKVDVMEREGEEDLAIRISVDSRVVPNTRQLHHGRWSKWVTTRTWVRFQVSIGSLLLGSGVFAQSPQTAPLNPAFVEYLVGAKVARPLAGADGLHTYGWVPSPVDLSHLQGQGALLARGPLATYASSYDLRTLGKVTSVKNQNPYGTCWAHATFGSMESCLLPSESRDFSENNLANLHGFDYTYDQGGNATMSMAYLTRWGGPINETDDPYPNPVGSPGGLTVRKHVQQVRLIPVKASATDNDGIKQALMDYGGLYVNYYHNDAYYNPTYKSYCYTGTSSGNHAVTIVGWDDNFDKNKFNSVPAGNGAYIVKNSWGTGWGESGYYYVSYYDTKFAYREIYAFLNAETTANYVRNYSYDPLGWVSDFGGSSTYWGANIFTAAASAENLGAVGFYANTVNTAYVIYIYTGVTAGAPRSGTLAATQSGTCSYPGYRTITLDTPASVTAGQRFSIVLKLTTPGYSWPLPFEYSLAGYSSAATASAGQSYYSSAGSTWTDLTTYKSTANFCIKGYTVTDTISPTFSSVVASPTLARLGTAVTITFTASETLSGSPTVTVNTHAASYVTKTGNNYTYSYTIQSSDADGAATIAISGTDVAGNPGSASSTTALSVDKTAPTISSITSTNANGTYGQGAVIDVTLNFSEPVTLVGGDLVITLETGNTDREVRINTISVTNRGSGVYAVQASDLSPDLSVKGVSLSGVTLRDEAGNDANLSIPVGNNMDDNKGIVIVTRHTLQIVSPYDNPNPAVGAYTRDYGTWLTNSVDRYDARGTTQYACTGWVMTGNADTNGASAGADTNLVMVLTNEATLTWAWQTQYWLSTSTNGNGTVTAADGWYAADGSTNLTATAGANWHFSGWSGDTNGCGIAGNVITATMTQARSITANFAVDRKTLTVVSEQGGASPGTETADYNTALSQFVTNSPVSGGVGTQYVCTAGAVVGNDYTQVSPTNVTLTLTNNAVLTWRWITNVNLTCSAGANGSISGACNEWYQLGGSVTVTANPANYYRFVAWMGTVNSTSNPLSLTMNQSHFVVAQFAVNLAAKSTPTWWLAQYGWTNNFDAAETNDADHDGSLNWQEYIAGTDPTNRLSVLCVTNLRRSESEFVLYWPSASNRTYGVDRATNLVVSGFSAIATNLLATPPTNVYTDQVPVIGKAFYRINVEKP